MIPDALRPLIEYQAVVGSRAFGLAGSDSDYDRRGFYVATPAMLWSLTSYPEQLEDPEGQECYWELAKFLKLALKGNPNVLETLHSPLVERAGPFARELIGMRSLFLSKRVYGTYLGYADQQFAKLVNKRERAETNWRHAMHMIRLLEEGLHLLNTGELRVDVGERRGALLAIRRGDVDWHEVIALKDRLASEMLRAYERTALPEHPDEARADSFLISVRRRTLG